MIKYKMDNRGKAAALVGLSAIGSILAYYGYSQYSNEEPDNTVLEVENDSNKPDDMNGTLSETISDTVSNYLTKIVSGENMKLQVDEKSKPDLKKSGKEVLKKALGTNVLSEEQVDGRKTWSKYWTNEYNKQQTGDVDNVAEAKDTQEATSSDFN